MELLAQLGLVVGGEVGFLLQLMLSMGKRTSLLEFALPPQLPVLTHFSLILHLIVLYKVISLIVISELLLRSLHSGCIIRVFKLQLFLPQVFGFLIFLLSTIFFDG